MGIDRELVLFATSLRVILTLNVNVGVALIEEMHKRFGKVPLNAADTDGCYAPRVF